MIETAIDQDGRVIVYFSSNKPGVPSMALEPRFLYMPDSTLGVSRFFRGQLLYATFSTKLEPEYLSKCLDMSGYRVSYAGNTTTIMYTHEFMVRSDSDALGRSSNYTFTPFCDPTLTLSEAVAFVTRLDPRGHMPNPYPRSVGPWGSIAEAMFADKIGFVRPVFDVTGNGPPMFIYSKEFLTRKTGINHGDPIRHANMLLRDWASKKGFEAMSFKPKVPPTDASHRQQFFFIDHIIGAIPMSSYPLGIAPPEPIEDSVGRTFDYGMRTWSIAAAFEPKNKEIGWEYLVVSNEEGKPVYASMSQSAFERIIQKAELEDYVPWKNPPQTYGSTTVDINIMALNTRLRSALIHKKSTKINNGDKFVFYELRHRDVMITRFDKVDGKMMFKRSMLLTEWRARARQRQARIQRERENSEAISNLTGLLEDTSNNAIDVLSSLLG